MNGGRITVAHSRLHASRRARRALAFALFALPGVAAGCSSLTAPPEPPSGGSVIVLDYDEFVAEVEPVLQRHGCDQDGDCHGGGRRGTLQLSPPTAKNLRYDFDQISLQVSPTVRDSSRLLTEPLALAAGGTPHAIKPFATTADTDFVALRTWIQNGVVR